MDILLYTMLPHLRVVPYVVLLSYIIVYTIYYLCSKLCTSQILSKLYFQEFNHVPGSRTTFQTSVNLIGQ